MTNSENSHGVKYGRPYVKVIEIDKIFIFSSPHEIIYVLFAGQRQNYSYGDHHFLQKRQKAEVVFKGD